MNGILNAVAPQNPGFSPAQFISRLLAFSKDSSSRQPPEPFRNGLPLNRDRDISSGFGRDSKTAIAESVGFHFISMARNRNPRLLPHQLGQIESDHSGIVGNEPDVVSRAQLNHRHRPPACFLHDRDSARLHCIASRPGDHPGKNQESVSHLKRNVSEPWEQLTNRFPQLTPKSAQLVPDLWSANLPLLSLSQEKSDLLCVKI